MTLMQALIISASAHDYVKFRALLIPRCSAGKKKKKKSRFCSVGGGIWN